MDSIARRFSWHDFKRPGWYLLTLETAVRNRNVLAEVLPDGFRPTAAGLEAERQWRRLVAATGGAVTALSFQLMPDHLHALVHVARPLDRPLGSWIGAYKAAVTAVARRFGMLPPGQALWAPGFDWRLKTSPREVAGARTYADNNPAAAREKRKARRRWGAAGAIAHRRLPGHWPDGAAIQWTAFGNPALLDAPRLVPVRVSRREPEEKLRRIEARAAVLAREGAVPVSPGISPGEKRALAAALRAGGWAIHLETRPIDAYYKPGPLRLAALAEGRWLALSPVPAGARPKGTKAFFEALNALAKEVCK